MPDVKPVRHRAAPRYPTRDYLLEHPELLNLVPKRWRHNSLVLNVLSNVVGLALAVQAHACGVQPNTQPASRVAPLFIHGEGRGSFGCIVINPPVFLSEDEARQVILEEAKKAGLEFAPEALALRDVAVPVTDAYLCLGPDGRVGPDGRRADTQTGTLIMDGFDRRRNVAFEFVSMEDHRAWQAKNLTCWSSVSRVDAKAAADTLRSGMKPSRPRPWLGVFYEPMAGRLDGRELRSLSDTQGRLDSFEQRVMEGRKVDAEELRKQVRDFIEWLKAQGVI